MRRREFLVLAAGTLLAPRPSAAAPFPVRFRKANPWESLIPQIEPGHDEFPIEAAAGEIRSLLEGVRESGSLPLAAGFRGASPAPHGYRKIAEDTLEAEFDAADSQFSEGLKRWLESLGAVRAARWFVLPDDLVRYEIASAGEYRVGLWKLTWADHRLASFHPVSETIARRPQPLFRDITAEVFGRAPTFAAQLAKGVPYWRARLDSACGIDVYGNNGIAAGDIDNDGWDEIYVCQPGGLPNRLYKNRGNGEMEDITERAGVAVLDDTSSALFLDLRNSGRQDLVVLRAAGPLLFLNDGTGRFRHQPEAFRFRSKPQGTFTGMAAADFDRDGNIDFYLCCYSYFQSEDQYTYPVPYHDAQNGPPNFLFRGRNGAFEDVTAETGLGENNNRFSFAAAWCDYDGDGWPDLYVANDFGRNNLYKNEKGRFRDVAREAGVEDIGPGMSASWFDYDGDGRQDLYISNMWSDAGQRLTRQKQFDPADPYRRHAKGNSLYRNRGDGRFDETGREQGAEMGRWAWGSDACDFDNDGSPEIYVACGMLTNTSEKDLASFFWRQVVAKSPKGSAISPEYENGWNAINQFIREDYSWEGREPNVFYARRNGHYYDFSGVSGLDFADDSRAFAITDLDGDGNLDLLVKNRLGPQVRAFENNSAEDRRSIALRLTGTKSNRDGIGAHVDVDGQVKVLCAGSGFLSQHTKVLHFGLSRGQKATTVKIVWPSGAEQEFRDLAAGFRYEITEGSPEVKSRPFRLRAPRTTGGAVQPDNHQRNETTWLLEPVPLPVQHSGPGLLTIGPEDLRRTPPETAASYALFRRYLFDWRTGLELPLILLLDREGRAVKFYASAPDAATVASDLQIGQARALPFRGEYYSEPHRNYFRLGAAFYWAGYPEQALVYLEEVVRRNPENHKALLAIGQIHLDAGRPKEARPYAERAVKANPQSAEAWNNLGGVECALGNPKAGLAHYERALEIRPDAPFILLNAGEARATLGDAAAAERLFRRAAEADPKNPEPANQLGLLAAKQKRNDEARRWFQQAITIQNDYAGAINNLAMLYLETGQKNDAIAAFEYGIKVAPDEEILYLNLGRVFTSLGQRAQARDIMRRLLERKPGSAVAAKALRDLDER